MNWPLIENHLMILTPVILVFWAIVKLTVKIDTSQLEDKIDARLDIQSKAITRIDAQLTLLMDRIK